jgi:hypothetical protein
VIESASRSTTLPYPSDRSELAGESAADRLRLQQRNSAGHPPRRPRRHQPTRPPAGRRPPPPQRVIEHAGTDNVMLADDQFTLLPGCAA